MFLSPFWSLPFQIKSLNLSTSIKSISLFCYFQQQQAVLNVRKIKNTCFYIFLMSNSKSPKKDSVPPPVEVDPQMKERARKAQAQHSKKKEDLLDKYSYHIVFGILILLLLIALVNSLWKSGPDVYTTLVNDPDYIAKINSQELSFKVGPTNMFEGYTLVDAKKTINVQSSNKQQLFRCNPAGKDTIIPDTYNFRTENPNCAKPIYTQGNCSSSYSIAAATAISDRICKQSNGENTFQVSPQSPIFCDKFINSQCKGGFISRTLDYAKLYGLVDTSCLPYNSASEDTPQTCQEKLRDCKRINIGDYCVSSQTENIKLEIFHYGPVVTTIPIYRDFLIYKEGLYQVYPKNQKFSTEHAVKIIGWDLIDGKNAWIIQNSWGTDWGINGTAYIVAQSEELHIERFTLAIALNQETEAQTEAIQTETLQTDELEQTQTEQVQEIDL